MPAKKWAVKNKIKVAYVSDSELRHPENPFKLLFKKWWLKNYFSNIEFFLSVGDANASTKVTVYPNPADTRILVNAGGEQLNSYRLYDMGGKLIKSGKPQKQGTSSEINVQELPSGVYMLHLSFDKKSSGHRIIIK